MAKQRKPPGRAWPSDGGKQLMFEFSQPTDNSDADSAKTEGIEAMLDETREYEQPTARYIRVRQLSPDEWRRAHPIQAQLDLGSEGDEEDEKSLRYLDPDSESFHDLSQREFQLNYLHEDTLNHEPREGYPLRHKRPELRRFSLLWQEHRGRADTSAKGTGTHRPGALEPLKIDHAI
jgi:hypothetical protein